MTRGDAIMACVHAVGFVLAISLGYYVGWAAGEAHGFNAALDRKITTRVTPTSDPLAFRPHALP